MKPLNALISLHNLLLIVPSLLLGGCAVSECLENQNSRPNAVFLASGGALVGTKVKIDSLTIYGIGAPGDSMLTKNAGLTGLTLPFRLGEESTTYVFRYGGALKGISDTLTFTYKSVPEFVSAACGAIYAFEDVEVKSTDWLIDSVACPWSVINNVERDYIRIYFRTSQSE